MNLRRTIATLLAALMLLALTACGAGTTSPAQDANDPAEETAPSTTESSQLRVGMECAYAPSNWQESAATDTNVPVENVAGAYAEGYDVQIARILADQLGKELVIVKLSWDGLIDALNQGQIDAIIAGMMDTAERRESINFSDPYKETIYSMMVLAGSPYENATSIQNFSGAAVLGQQGTALDDVIDQIEGVEHLSPVGSVPDMISRLQQGTCDAIVINEESAPGYLASNPDFRLITFGEGDGTEAEAPAATPEAGSACSTTGGCGYSVFVGKDFVGDGDLELGRNLMKMALYTLSEAGDPPTSLLFMNAGVKLVAPGEEQVIEAVKKLEEQGTEVLVCGTCLNFFGIADKLSVGEVSNMYDILERMRESAKTITL